MNALENGPISDTPLVKETLRQVLDRGLSANSTATTSACPKAKASNGLESRS